MSEVYPIKLLNILFIIKSSKPEKSNLLKLYIINKKVIPKPSDLQMSLRFLENALVNICFCDQHLQIILFPTFSGQSLQKSHYFIIIHLLDFASKLQNHR